MPVRPALLSLAFLGLAACTAAAVDPPCAPGDPMPWWCVQEGATGPLCGDVRFNPSCVEGAWTCPYSNLVPDRAHACVCFDGPRPLGHSCTCTDGGVVSCTIPCGALRCRVGGEYCAITSSDVGGEPDASACAPLLEPCAGVGCACVAAGALSCEEDVGAVTAHYPGG